MAAEKNRAGGTADRTATADGDFSLVDALSSPIAVIEGINPSARAEQDRTLRQAQKQLRALVARSPYGIYVLHADGHVAEVNPALCRMLGYSREEMVGKTVTDFVPRADVERLREAWLLAQRQSSHQARWNLTRKDGTQLPVEVAAWVLGNGDWQGFVRDLTEGNRLAEMLRVTRSELALSRSHLRTIVDNAYQFIGLLAPDGTLLEANRSALRLVEARREDTIGRPFWETPWWAGDPEQRKRLRDGIAAARQGRFVRFDATHPTADGRTVDVDFSLTPVRDALGNVALIVPEGRDITDRRRVEEALRRSEARLARLLSAAPDAIIAVDEDQRIVLFNREAEHTFGWKSEEVLNQPLDILIPPRFRARHREHIREFAREAASIRSMTDRQWPIFGVRKNGEEFPIEAAISNVDLEGMRTFAVMLRDVSKRVSLERELNRRLEQQRLLVDLAAALAKTSDYDEALIEAAELIAGSLATVCIAYAATDGEIRRVRVACKDPARAAAAEELERQPLDAVQLGAVRSLISSEQLRFVKELTPEVLRSALQNEEHYARLAALDPRSGIAVPLVIHGRPLGALVFLSSNVDRLYGDEDVSLATLVAGRTALALDALRSLQIARDAARDREALIGFIAHDLRNPLNVVGLAVQRIADLAPTDADEIRRGLATIARSAARANRLVEDLLDLRRPEDDLTLASRPTSPRRLVAEVLETQRVLVDAASLTLQIDVPDDLPAVQIDRDRIAQVLENLMANAVKFTPPGGRILVRAVSQDQDVLFCVKDSGRGITSQALEHVFDLYWRGPTRAHAGLGMGLPIARRVVEAHGGHIWIESQEGAGCTVFFTLPKAVARHPLQHTA
jgi:PAS domain S-box-containing protein